MRAQWCSLRTGSWSSSISQGALENEGKRRFRRSLLFVPCLVVNGIRAVLTLQPTSPLPAPFPPCLSAYFPVFPNVYPFPFGIYAAVVRSRRKVAGWPPADGGSRRKNDLAGPAFSPSTATNTFPVPRILLEITSQPSRNPVSAVLRQEGGRLKCRAARHGMALSAVPERK